MRTPTPVLAEAMRILSIEVISDDGVANAVIAEAAQRLGELHRLPLAAEEDRRVGVDHFTSTPNCTKKL